MWDIDLLKPKAEQMRRLMHALPRNSYSLPEGIYRCDLLKGESTIDESGTASPASPATATSSQASHIVPTRRTGTEALAAYIPLSYSDGFPTLPSGKPVWARFEWEPEIAFKLFQLFLRLGQLGVRTLFTVNSEARLNNIVHPWSDAPDPNVGINLLADLFVWHDRARSFDLFEIVEIRKATQRRAIQTMDRHYVVASSLLKTAVDHLSKEDSIATLTNREAIELIKVASQLQRISVGLSATGPNTAKQEDPTFAPGVPNEIVLGDTVKRQGIPVSQRRSADLQSFLKDPQMAKQAQDIVLRLRGTPPIEAIEDKSIADSGEVSEEELEKLESEAARDAA